MFIYLTLNVWCVQSTLCWIENCIANNLPFNKSFLWQDKLKPWKDMEGIKAMINKTHHVVRGRSTRKTSGLSNRLDLGWWWREKFPVGGSNQSGSFEEDQGAVQGEAKEIRRAWATEDLNALVTIFKILCWNNQIQLNLQEGKIEYHWTSAPEKRWL